MRRNLELCFPEESVRTRERWLREHFRALSQSFVDRGVLWYGSAQAVCDMVHMTGYENIKQQFDAGKPVLLLVPHFIALDATGTRFVLAMREDKPAAATMYTPQRDPVVNDIMNQGRARFSKIHLVSRHDGVRELVRHLRNLVPVYYLPDMDFGAEGAAFVTGTGSNQPKGFLSAPTAATGDAVRAFGTLQYLVSGNATGFDAAPELKLIDLVHALKAGHRQGASWVMNSATLAQVRKLKDANGAFLWQPGLAAGQPDRLLGYPVVDAADMPDLAAGAFPIAFGNFQAGYLIAERSATTVLRDPFTNKPFVHFYAVKRIGGQVLDSDAIKLLKISA